LQKKGFQQIKHLVEIRTDYDNKLVKVEGMMAWLHKQDIEYSFAFKTPSDYPWPPQFDCAGFWFKNKEDAALFKLVWG